MIQILTSLFISLAVSSIVGLLLGKKFDREKQLALRQLASDLSGTHTETHNFLVALQTVIFQAKDLAEVKRYLQGKSDEFIRSLRPCKVVTLPTKHEEETDPS